MPRLGYKKSRGGCQKCKQRRIKCDEKSPCSACLRHGVECSLETRRHRSRDILSPGNSPETAPLVHEITRQDDGNPHTTTDTTMSSDSLPTRTTAEHDVFSYFASFGAQEQRRESTSQRIMDLMLMHHYTSITWQTLPKGPDRDEIWQLALPRLAGSYPFLMHQLLGLSARHMAFLGALPSAQEQPVNGSLYSLQASQHQEMAVQGLRNIVLDISQANCHAIFAAATLLPISAFASHAEHVTAGGQGPSFENLLEIFALLRGMNGILQRWEPVLEHGPLGKILQLGPDVRDASTGTNLYGDDEEEEEDRGLLAEITEHLQKYILLPPNTPAPGSHGDGGSGGDYDGDGAGNKRSTTITRDINAILRTEAAVFTNCINFARSKSAGPEHRVATLWPLYISDDFLRLMQERHASAMPIVTFYARILCAIQNENWYMKGWGENVLGEIDEITSRQI